MPPMAAISPGAHPIHALRDSPLAREWADSSQLWREIRALGYAHSARTLCPFITQPRRAADAGLPPESQGSRTPTCRGRPPVGSHSPCSVQPRSGQARPRCVWTSAVRWMPALRGRMR
jgi:hypothetical protein